MNLIRKTIRKIILESKANWVKEWTQELSKKFNVKIETPRDNNIGFELTQKFPVGCSVLIFIIMDYSGVDDQIYMAELATKGKDCFNKGYARKAFVDFLSVSDRFNLEVHLTAASEDEKRFPNRELVKFYESLGFFPGGNPNKGFVEMFRPSN